MILETLTNPTTLAFIATSVGAFFTGLKRDKIISFLKGSAKVATDIGEDLTAIAIALDNTNIDTIKHVLITAQDTTQAIKALDVINK